MALEILLGALVEATTAHAHPEPTPTTQAAGLRPEDDRWRVQRPNRGGAGRYLDSNVPEVWKGVPLWVRQVGLCIRKHESIMAGHYKAHNGSSSASGAYQFLDGTWQGVAKWTKVKGEFVARKYAAANHAPAWVQDSVFIHSVLDGGLSNWRGTGCPGT